VTVTLRAPPVPSEPLPAVGRGEEMPREVAKALRDMLRHHGRRFTAEERRAIRWVLVREGELGSLLRIPGAIPREEPAE
jgi:hypothetical protein